MGGKNHQPCNQYLAESTRLSRNLSLAYAELELGNVALEDALLAELEQREPPSSQLILNRLGHSRDSLSTALICCRNIRAKMLKKEFSDLSTIQKTDLEQMGQDLAKDGLISLPSGEIIVQLMKSGGFGRVLEVISTRITEIISLTDDLDRDVQSLYQTANKSNLEDVLEKNLPGNIKVGFAKLYTAWSEFNSFFLASSLFSTELWYRYTGCDSLCSKDKVAVVAA